MKTRFSQMTGEPELLPGTATFQAMFLLGDHSVGGVAVVEVPLPVGPRQCGQLSADATWQVIRASTMVSGFMGLISLKSLFR
ncbi:MAG: hypothetical protein Aurels2KO_00410 [Aureliella sp.]